jgi:large subunit ribosomal protein L7/L12
MTAKYFTGLLMVLILSLPAFAQKRSGAKASPALSAPATEEQTEFDVILMSGGEQTTRVVGIVRHATGLGLKEAKDLVANAPQPVRKGIDSRSAEELKRKFEEAGATVEIR